MVEVFGSVLTAVGVAAGIIALLATIAQTTFGSYSGRLIRHSLESKVAFDKKVYARLQEQLDELNKVIESRPESLDKAYVAKLEAKVEKIEQDITSLRQLLFDNPDLVITIPLMKKDISALQNDVKTTREQFDRIASFSRWIIGIMATLSLGMLSIAAAAIFNR